MSAIAGIWRFDGRPDAREKCSAMLSAQAIYGRDHVSCWADVSVAYGRRLHRALPEDISDNQPVIGPRGRVLVADLRLDNRDELCGLLSISSGNARAMSDAAILFASLERWGDDCVRRLVGDYAFAGWDSAERSLLLARDPLGRRPLHYWRNANAFAVASMPKGLHALAEVPHEPDDESIAEFLTLLPQEGSRTFYREIERVPPGHIVRVTAGRIEIKQFWQPRRRALHFKTAEDYADALRGHLDVAVRCRLRGVKRGVGAHLSAGLDSSAVAATAARLLSDSGRVFVFTAVPREGYQGSVPPQKIGDEGPLAAATAALYHNMEHRLVRTSGRSPLHDLDRNVFLYDQPILNICNSVWVHAINDAAKAHGLTIMLSGELGNFSLSYDGAETLSELLRRGHWLRLWREAHALVSGKMRWRGVAAQTFGPWVPKPIWLWGQRRFRGVDRDVRHYTAIHPARLSELSARAQSRGLDFAYRPWSDGFQARVWALRRVDPGNYIKGTLGGWGIDLRDPTADLRLVEFCLSVPTEQFFSKGTNRALARRALADRLPPAVIDEQRKGLQGIDWHEALTAARAELAAEVERIGTCRAAARVVDVDALRRLIREWPSGEWDRDDIVARYRLALLRAVSGGHFLRRVSGANV